MRETFPLPTVDDVLAQLNGATVFSKLDANSGFWQVPLAPQSRHLTMFITHFGRYQFNKLPFGISSAPEVYQKRMSSLLEGLIGVLCLIDDVLVFGHTAAEHDRRLQEVLRRIQSSGATLNVNKCAFHQTRIKFLGHNHRQERSLRRPREDCSYNKNATSNYHHRAQTFFGHGQINWVNFLSIFQSWRTLFASCLVQRMPGPGTQCCRRRSWLWKMLLTKPTVLATYSPVAETKVSADASSHKPWCSPPTETTLFYTLEANSLMLPRAPHRGWESLYAQIEKEALASTWACERFTDYILGKHVTIETDHKPLVSLLHVGSKQLNDLLLTILRFRLRLSRFDYSIEHTPGKQLHTADVLSRATPTIREREST